MTRTELTILQSQLDKLITQLQQIYQEIGTQEYGDTNDPELAEVSLTTDDSDIENWLNGLDIIKNEIETIQIKLSGNL